MYFKFALKMSSVGEDRWEKSDNSYTVYLPDKQIMFIGYRVIINLGQYLVTIKYSYLVEAMDM